MTSSPTPNTHEHPHPIYTENEIDLRQMSRALWRFRLPFLLLTLIGGVMGAVLSVLSTTYVSQGLFLSPELTLTTYKQYEAVLDNEPRLRGFIKSNGLLQSQTAGMLEKLLERRERLFEAVQPVFSITGKDARAFDIKSDETGGLVGIQLKLERRSKIDDAPLIALAEYVRSSIIQHDLKEAVLKQCLENQSRERLLRNESIQNDFAIRQNDLRAASLQSIIDSTPGADEIDNRQVVSLENGAERFLSPTAQLVAVGVSNSELKLMEEKRIRDRLAAVLRRDYYCRARDAAKKIYFGPEFLAQLVTLKAEVFKGKDLTVDIVEQTANELDIEQQGWNDRYLELTRFVVSPDGAERKVRRPPLMMGIVLGLLVGGLLGVLLSLASGWWHDHREEIVSTDEA